jgi:hypothetical protein
MRGISESIFDLLDNDHFRRMSGMYLGQKRIDILRGLLEGYMNAVKYWNITDDKAIKFERFREWLIEYYSEGQYNAGWDYLILYHCNNDQYKAVDTFFELYDKFNSR